MHIASLAAARIELLRAAWDDRARFEARQLGKFRALARFAKTHSRYYAGVMKRIDPDRCRPDDFPILTKRDVMNNFDDIVTVKGLTRHGVMDFLSRSRNPADLYLGRFVVLHTSGSSGEVGLFVRHQREWSQGLTPLASSDMFGCFCRRQRMAFVGATNGHFTGVSVSTAVAAPPIGWMFRVTTHDINRPFTQTIDELNAAQPDIVSGYASALDILADHQIQGGLTIRPRILISSGDLLTPAARAKIRSAFGVDTYDIYISTEHLVMAARRPGQSRMQLFEDNLLFEPRADHTLVTNLCNRTMPLIRYQMNDVIEYAPEPENRGRHRTLRRITGRFEQVPIFINRHGIRDWISPHVINEILVRHVRQFQMRVLDDRHFDFILVLDAGLSDADHSATLSAARERLSTILAEKEMENVAFRLVVADDLNPDPQTGKFRLIVVPATPAGDPP